MTDKQWTQVKNYLNCYGKAKLKIDDHYVTLTTETTRNRLYYSMNIDDATEAERENLMLRYVRNGLHRLRTQTSGCKGL